MHERLRDISHIVYTSATLGTSERIHRTMGSFDIISVLNEKDLKSQMGTMGTRIIFPLNDVCTTGKIDEKVLVAIDNLMSFFFTKVLVMCNSFYDAEKVINFIRENGKKATLYQGETDSTHFAAEEEGAFVAAGRFIGLDYSKVCGVAVVTRMPYILGPVDILVKNILEDAEYSDEKVSHRLVWGAWQVQPKSR